MKLPLHYGKVNSRTDKKLRCLYQDKRTSYTQSISLSINKYIKKQKITLKTQKLLKITDKIINDGSAERSLQRVSGRLSAPVFCFKVFNALKCLSIIAKAIRSSQRACAWLRRSEATPTCIKTSTRLTLILN